jgi:hypothetical protein
LSAPTTFTCSTLTLTSVLPHPDPHLSLPSPAAARGPHRRLGRRRPRCRRRQPASALPAAARRRRRTDHAAPRARCRRRPSRPGECRGGRAIRSSNSVAFRSGGSLCLKVGSFCGSGSSYQPGSFMGRVSLSRSDTG